MTGSEAVQFGISCLFVCVGYAFNLTASVFSYDLIFKSLSLASLLVVVVANVLIIYIRIKKLKK